MNALYIMRYGGIDGSGGGTLYIGNGKILGSDVGLCRYEGIYEEKDGVFYVDAKITALADTSLVSGHTLQASVCPKTPSIHDFRLRLPPRQRVRRRLRCRDPGLIALSGRRTATWGLEFALPGDTGARAAVPALGGVRNFRVCGGVVRRRVAAASSGAPCGAEAGRCGGR